MIYFLFMKSSHQRDFVYRPMKTLCSMLAIVYAGFLVVGTVAVHAADAPQAVDSVRMKDNRVWTGSIDSQVQTEKDVSVALAVVVKTNGVFTVNGGTERKLLEGQSIQSDGNMVSPDGSIMPVFDHVVVRAGKTVFVKDGVSTPLSQAYSLGNGGQMMPDGYLVEPGGRRIRLLDGQLVKLDGTYFPAKDTALMRQGQVTVQKDGSLLRVGANSSMMMNDGTRIYGDGRVVSRDGKVTRLQENQVLQIEGVVVRNR
jgi:hypothetical protein